MKLISLDISQHMSFVVALGCPGLRFPTAKCKDKFRFSVLRLGKLIEPKNMIHKAGVGASRVV